MLDVRFIRENKDLIKEAARKKHIAFDVEDLIAVDDRRKAALQAVEAKRAEQNKANERIAQAKEPAERAGLIGEMKAVKDRLEQDEETLKDIMHAWQLLMVNVPNVPDISVPEGASDAQNKEIRTWGKIPKFDFKPKSHIELMENLNLLELERGAKVSGFRGYFLKNEAVQLNFALWQFVMDYFATKNFTPIIVPSLVRRETLLGTGYLPQGEDDMYKTQDGDYLAGTGEVGAMGYYLDEILDKKKLPIKFFAFSPCFRREAGSHGKDTKGLMRVHEFFKFEQVVLCEASHEETVKHHEEITKNAEEIMQALQIPYRVVINCGADLGLGQVKKYDIEAWVPSEKKYRETHSSSYFHDFQTRRMNIRYKDDDGKLKFAHSLNSTALATPRPIISIVENNQQEDGSIVIPDVLQKYMGNKKVISIKLV